ncbi:alkaline phosphatase family protein [Roseateles amylovorans]|uniref:Alkaline phosphatase family protein n=1 Tax=Roseateles amylovorans TaxID=2978473 RepID=A0ABY6AS88_9BURK|nr:alkaline phosphatase family protein [Roseateles amylovorans]UXH76106.1 alkaline phosphatase family protein [Roseateles amylovorans]
MKALIVIAEGMDPTVLTREVAAGRLPWFGEQMRQRRYAPMDCGPVPYEPVNLATAFSGMNPGRHGCFSYWSAHSAGEMPRVLVTDDVQVPRVWEWESLSDLRFSVVNVQLTHPPKPLNGRLISYPMQYTMNASHPRSLLSDLLREGVRYAHDVTLFYRGESFDEFAAQAWRVAAAQLQAAQALARDTDVMIVNLTLIDRVSHFLWYEMRDPAPPQRPTVLRAYDFVDQACRALQALGAETTMVFSEMGFGELDGFVSIDDLLLQAGLQHRDADGQVDLARSLAMETVQGSHGVMLCRDLCNTGRATAAEIDTVRQALAALRFPNGQPVIGSVHHRDELYTGPFRHLAPSLVIKPADERRPPLGERRWATHVRRTAQSGWHRDRGFMVLDAPGAELPQGQPVQLQQIAPTIAEMLGREAPAGCERPSLMTRQTRREDSPETLERTFS